MSKMLSSNGSWQVLTLHPRERISCWWKNSQLSSLATCAAGWLTGSQLTGHENQIKVFTTAQLFLPPWFWADLPSEFIWYTQGGVQLRRTREFPTRKHHIWSYMYFWAKSFHTVMCMSNLFFHRCSRCSMKFLTWHSSTSFFVSRRIVSFLSEAEGCLGGLEVRERHLSEDCEAATSHGVAWEGLLDWIFLRFEQIEQKHVIASIASLQ